jgi:hypothetical protein
MITEQPLDVRRMIYLNLNLESLVNLSSVSRLFYRDNLRKDVIILKLLEECFYVDDSYIFSSRCSPFPSVCTYQYFEQRFYEYMLSLSFSDVKIFHNKVEIEKYGTTKSFYNNSNLSIVKRDFVHQQHIHLQLIETLFRYLFDISQYKKEHPSTYIISSLFDSILEHLEKMIVYGDKETRNMIIHRFEITSLSTL